MIYKEIIQSKTGLSVPVFKSLKPAVSKYNPERDADNFCTTIPFSSFFLVTGLCSGLHIKKLHQKYPESVILVLENSREDIDFLENGCPEIREIIDTPGLFITDLQNLEANLLQLYIPSLYDTFYVCEYRPWTEENGNRIEEIRGIIHNAIEKISVDFSTQVRFGKLWQHNIMKNLKTAGMSKTAFIALAEKSLAKIKNSSGKTALVLAAGPTLETELEKIIENRSEYFIISTDTALSPCFKKGIIPDTIVSIDGQFVSHSHFMDKEKLKLVPHYVFDLNANPSTVRLIQSFNKNIIFSSSGHPLAIYAEKTNDRDCFLKLESGSGTVTISALDFAVKSGFSKILVLGADFSYSKGKSYARGTYLDLLYNANSSKILSSENLYSKLYFRSPFINLNEQRENIKHTQMLTNYENSFENYLFTHNLIEEKTDGARIITRKCTEAGEHSDMKSDFDYNSFVKKLNLNIATLEKLLSSENSKPSVIPAEVFSEPLFSALLPFCAEKRSKKVPLCTALKLALEDIKRYTV